MSVLRFDEVALTRALSQLPGRRASAFAAACASRLAHDVTSLQAGSQSDRLLIDAQSLLWRAIESGVSLDTSPMEEMLLDAMPNEDDDNSFEAAVVEDAFSATIYAMRSIYVDSSQNAAWSARRSYETADRYASIFLNDPEYSDVAEEKILNHRIVQLELQRQERDLNLVKVNDSMVGDTLKVMIQSERVLEPDGN